MGMGMATEMATRRAMGMGMGMATETGMATGMDKDRRLYEYGRVIGIDPKKWFSVNLRAKLLHRQMEISHLSAPVAKFQLQLSRIASPCTKDDGEPFFDYHKHPYSRASFL